MQELSEDNLQAIISEQSICGRSILCDMVWEL